MDSLTQVVLGASVQAAMLGRWQGRKALLYGAVLATLPDLDVVLDYGDAVYNMTNHRGFSHSLIVLSGLALLLTPLLRMKPNPGYSAGRLFMTLWLVLCTHPLLDSFTSYGTQLFWPFQPPPIAWSTIFIIDPLYTLPLLMVVIVGLIRGLKDRGPALAVTGLVLSSLYLGFTVAGKFMAEERVRDQLASQGITLDKLRVFSAPMPFNSLLWRVVAMNGDTYYEGVTGWLDHGAPQVLALPSGKSLRHELDDSPQAARLTWFTSGFLRYDDIDGRILVTDLRLGTTGFHPFRFAMSRWNGSGWSALPHPERVPTYRGGAEELALIWQRIWSEDPPLPLETWTSALGRTGTAATAAH